MADNLIAKANVGDGTDILATKDIGGVQHPKTLLVSADGSEIAAGNALPVSVTTAQRTASLTRATGGATVSAGAKSVSFGNFGAVGATVAGATLEPNESVDFNAPLGDTLAAIAYDGTGTELLIAEVR